jgi:hypothetical protein
MRWLYSGYIYQPSPQLVRDEGIGLLEEKLAMEGCLIENDSRERNVPCAYLDHY